jgi:hypothetical protein
MVRVGTVLSSLLLFALTACNLPGTAATPATPPPTVTTLPAPSPRYGDEPAEVEIQVYFTDEGVHGGHATLRAGSDPHRSG